MCKQAHDHHAKEKTCCFRDTIKVTPLTILAVYTRYWKNTITHP